MGRNIKPSKNPEPLDHLAQAKLFGHSENLREDALQTLQDLDAPIDLVLLDGWKDLYLPVLKLLVPKLKVGSVVMADNIFTFRKDLQPYVNYMQSGENGFESVTLHLADGFEYSVFTG